MNRFTKITAALLMGLALAGCSDSDDDDDDRDEGPEMTMQFSAWVSDMLNDDKNAEPRDVNSANLDFSNDNEDEQAFDDVLNN